MLWYHHYGDDVEWVAILYLARRFPQDVDMLD
jgi:hypothetical protein